MQLYTVRNQLQADPAEALHTIKDLGHHQAEQITGPAGRENLEYLVFGYMRPEEHGSKDQYMRHIQALNHAGEQCKSAGIQLAYYNHAFEVATAKTLLTSQ